MSLYPLTLILLLFTLARPAFSAETCDTVKAMGLLISLTSIKDTIINLSKIDIKAPLQEAKETLNQINQLQPTLIPEAALNSAVDQITADYLERNIAPLRKVVDSAEASINSGLKENSDIAEVFMKTFLASISARPTLAQDADLLEKGKHAVGYIQWYGKYMIASQALLQKLIDKSIACLPVQKSFESYVNGKKVSFNGCSMVTAFEPESETWGGKITVDECRHIVSCSEVKAIEPQTLPSAFWIVDCKTQNSTCPTVEKCAQQVQTGGARVTPSKPEGVTK